MVRSLITVYMNPHACVDHRWLMRDSHNSSNIWILKYIGGLQNKFVNNEWGTDYLSAIQQTCWKSDNLVMQHDRLATLRLVYVQKRTPNSATAATPTKDGSSGIWWRRTKPGLRRVQCSYISMWTSAPHRGSHALQLVHIPEKGW